MTLEQCQTTSWKSEGYQDGEEGKMPRDLTRAIQDCGKYKVPVNTVQYMQGYRRGAKIYCTPSQEIGILDGQSGKSINDINIRLPICNRAGISLNLTNYRKGLYAGLKQYCTYENGKNIASMGQELPEVCPKSLRANFSRGWQSGQQAYCQKSANGFLLGRSGKAYPSACPENLYMGFKSEYDRGVAITNRIQSGEARLQEIDGYINAKRKKYDLEQTSDKYYRIGDDQSADANNALTEVNNMVRERMNIERDMFNYKVAH